MGHKHGTKFLTLLEPSWLGLVIGALLLAFGNAAGYAHQLVITIGAVLWTCGQHFQPRTCCTLTATLATSLCIMMASPFDVMLPTTWSFNACIVTTFWMVALPSKWWLFLAEEKLQTDFGKYVTEAKISLTLIST